MKNFIKKDESYISGWEALNIPRANGESADWHPHSYPPVAKYNYNPIFKEEGIRYRYVPLLGKKAYVADYPRAIADLLYHGKNKQLKQCMYDFLSAEDARILYNYLKKIRNRSDIENFMKYELTLLYFEEKNAEISRRSD